MVIALIVQVLEDLCTEFDSDHDMLLRCVFLLEYVKHHLCKVQVLAVQSIVCFAQDLIASIAEMVHGAMIFGGIAITSSYAFVFSRILIFVQFLIAINHFCVNILALVLEMYFKKWQNTAFVVLIMQDLLNELLTHNNKGRKTVARKENRHVILAVICALIAFMIILRFSQAHAQPQEKSLQRVVIAQTSDFFLYAPIYIALDSGLFAKQGLDVSLVSTGGDEKTWAAVISGNASFGVADPTFVAVSAERGMPGKVIGTIVNGVPFWGVTFKDNIHEIKASKDLNGYSVATFPSPSTAYALQKKMFRDANIKSNIREGAFGTILAMLHSGQADIGLELEPNVSQAVAGGAKVVYSLADVYGDFAITGITASPKLLSQQSELARKVICGIQLALDFIRQDNTATLRILSRRFPEISATIARQALSRVLVSNVIPQTAVTSIPAWYNNLSLRYEVGDINTLKDMDVYVDNSFAEWAATYCRNK